MVKKEISQKLDFLLEKFDILYLINHMGYGVYIVDPDCRILFWNDVARNITGYPAEEVVGSLCRDNILVHQDRHGMKLCSTELCPPFCAMKTRKPVHVPFTVYAKKANDKRIPVNVISIPLLHENTVYGAICLFQYPGDVHFERESARDLQKQLIPHNLPENVQIYFHPAQAIGGDMIFHYGSWYVLYDVAGHGIAAAMVSTSVLTMMQKIFSSSVDIMALGDQLEESFIGLNVMDIYFTALIIKHEEDSLLVKSYGHLNPILIDENGDIQEIEVEYDYPIGFQLKHDSAFTTVPVKSKNRFVAFTDGIFQYCEENNKSKDQVYDLFGKHKDLSKIYRAVRHSCPEEYQQDDITILEISF